ncbi:hypothetical protein BC629DRAFT_1546405 [Irpex lacteus]|nr:hypothetical protein BC629DRAFT_1546405 [Irpex lacteus]
MHVDDEYTLDNGMFFDNAASDTPSDDSLFRSAPPTPVSVSSATHPPVTITPNPSYSPISPSPAPLKLRIPVTVSFNSEYSDSSSDDSSSEDSDITQHPQFPTPAHGSPPSSPLGGMDSEWEEGELPFPSTIFIPTMSYVRQIGLAVPPPRENENVIFYVNRPVSPATSEESSDGE